MPWVVDLLGSMDPLALFAIALLFFHCSEFGLAAVFQKQELGWRSLLLSKPYVLAMTLAAAEFYIENKLFPGLRSSYVIKATSLTGLAAVVTGASIRISAIMTARSNFTHTLRFEAAAGHRLITSGIYGIVRHPGYTGFFIWALGTQLLLCNPVCFVAFLAVVWQFFKERIPTEEQQLMRFFGQDHAAYKQNVHSGIPFID